MYQFSDKTDNFEFVGPNLPRNGFGINTSNISCFPIFSQIWENLGKLPNDAQHFGSNIVEGVAESWAEIEMSWLEVLWSWVDVEMSWVEVDGAGWR